MAIIASSLEKAQRSIWRSLHRERYILLSALLHAVFLLCAFLAPPPVELSPLLYSIDDHHWSRFLPPEPTARLQEPEPALALDPECRPFAGGGGVALGSEEQPGESERSWIEPTSEEPREEQAPELEEQREVRRSDSPGGDLEEGCDKTPKPELLPPLDIDILGEATSARWDSLDNELAWQGGGLPGPELGLGGTVHGGGVGRGIGVGRRRPVPTSPSPVRHDGEVPCKKRHRADRGKTPALVLQGASELPGRVRHELRALRRDLLACHRESVDAPENFELRLLVLPLGGPMLWKESKGLQEHPALVACMREHLEDHPTRVLPSGELREVTLRAR